ncbi:MAG: hypothetical protein J7J01_01600 [Methanophagales archaeon]|nr:hypothetical protein [Methanophagales archaeon]
MEEAGIIISAGKISYIMTQEKKEELTKEREEILKAGLESSSYFHIGDTGLNHEVQEINSTHRLPSRPVQKNKKFFTRVWALHFTICWIVAFT